MEFFKGVNVDWMGKAKYFVSLSLILLAIGWISILRNHGLKQGIDFRGGTLVYVRFAGTPPIDQIRKGLESAGLPNSTIQGISDINSTSKNDVVIGLEQHGQGDESLDAGKQAILDVLHKMFGTDSNGKQDFNSITPSALASYLSQRDPLSLSVNAGDRYNQLAQRLTDARDRDQGGIVTNFDQLKGVDGATPAVISSLQSNFSLGNFAIRNVEIVGP
jgi:preprotein translocase subunit SecF